MIKDLERPQYILLVDDNKILLESIEDCLNEIGYLVITAGNGLEAIEIIDRMDEQIGLLITDIRMPVLDGISLIRHVRLYDNQLPIIVITGFDKEEVLGQTADLDVVCIYKPLDINVLEMLIYQLWPKD